MSRPCSLLLVVLLMGVAVAPAIAAGRTAAPRVRAAVPGHGEEWAAIMQLRLARRWPEVEAAVRTLIIRHPDMDSLEVADAMSVIAYSYHQRKLLKDPRTFATFDSALAIYRRRAPPGDSTWAWASTRASVAAYDAALNERARADAREALGVMAAAMHPDTIQWSETLRALGTACVQLGRTDEVRDAYERAIALGPGTQSAMRYAYVAALGEYGNYLSRRGEFDEARGLLERALRWCESDGRRQDDLLEGVLGRLTTLEARAGNLAQAVEYARRSLDEATRMGSTFPTTLPFARIRLANRLSDAGDFAEAVRYYREALTPLDSLIGPRHPIVLNARLGLLAATLEAGDTTGVAAHLDELRARVARQPVFANDNQAFVSMLAGDLERLRGRFGASRDTLERAMGVEAAKHAPQGTTLATLLAHELRAAREPADRRHVERAAGWVARLRDSTHVRATPEWEDLVYERAAAELRVGLPDSAWTHALEAEALARDRLGYEVRALSDQRALQLAAQLGAPCELLVTLARTRGAEGVREAWDRLASWRGLVGREVARRRLPSPARGDTALVAAHARWVAAQRHLAQLVAGGTASALDPETAELFLVAKDRADEAERQYVRRAGASVHTRPAPTLAELRGTLRPGEALVGFATTSAEAGTQRLVAFVAVGGSDSLRCLDLGPSDEIAADVEVWRSALAAPPGAGAGARAAERVCRRMGLGVRTRLWDPIARTLGGVRDVRMVEEGPVFGLPWLALPGNGDRYLADEDVTVRVLTSEGDLANDRAEPGRGLLAVGGVDFDRGTAPVPAVGGVVAAEAATRRGASPCAGGPLALQALPGTAAEVADLAREWPASAGPVEILEGSRANEAGFKREAPGRAVIHLATHGVVRDDACREAAPGLRGVGGVTPLATLAPGPGRRATVRDTTARTADRAARPGSSRPTSEVLLALAGANRPVSESRDENEGLLTAEEVATLDLAGTDWVVLSACQSGVASSWAREGVLGMRRAFRMAGAHAVIASEWPVADQATRAWMAELYRARSAAASPGAAVREACRRVLAERRRAKLPTHPFYWAGFVAVES